MLNGGDTLKDMYFLFGDYKFPNKVNDLLLYFKSQEIEYYIKDDMIEFYTTYNDKSIIWTAIAYGDRICTLNGRCNTNDLSHKNQLLSLVTCKYSRDSIDSETGNIYLSKIPTKKNFIIKMVVNIRDDFVITVWFEDEKHKAFKNVAKIEDIKDAVGFISCGVIGIGLSVLFILTYINDKSFTPTLIMSVVSYIYMLVSIFIYNFRNHVDTKKNILYSLILPIIYTTIVFIILLLININDLKGNGILVLDLLVYSLLSMPAFILVIAIIFLLLKNQFNISYLVAESDKFKT